MTRLLPPGPHGRPFVGIMPDFARDTLSFMRTLSRYGDVTSMRFGPFVVFGLNSPDLVQHAIVKLADKMQKQTITVTTMKPVVGMGLFTSDGEFWRRQRRLAQPAFHTRRIGSYAQTIAAFAQAYGDRIRDGEMLDIERDMNALTMSIIAKVLFDADVTGEAAEVGEITTEVLHHMNERFNRFFSLPYWVPTPAHRRFHRLVARLDVLIQGFIDARRASGQDNGDLLSMLLMAQDEEEDTGGMSDQQVRDEAMTMFGAGHETTSVTMTWTWALLAQHPAIAAKLHAELDAVLGGRVPTFEDLPKLRYTEQVIKESMRLYPAAWGFTREATEDVEIGGFTLKKGEGVMVNTYGMHHDARYFPDPERFDPERFSEAREGDIPKYAYLPFGTGPRVCIGNAFAMMEAKLILATLAQRYTFALAPGQIVEGQRQFTLRPKYGMRMIAHARVPAPAHAAPDPAAAAAR